MASATAIMGGCCHQSADACASNTALAVQVTADRSTAYYLNGEQAVFMIEVTRAGRPATSGTVEVWLALDGGPADIVKKSFDLAAQNPIRVAGSVDQPGFLLCQAWAEVEQAQAFGEKMVWYRAPVDTTQVSIELTPDRPEALYRCGETATFTARVLQNEKPVRAGQLVLRLSREGGEATVAAQTFDLAAGQPLQIAGTLPEPSFLYCQARLTRPEADRNRPLTTWISVGYDVAKIVPVTTLPEDFETFWKDTLAQARQLPEAVEMEKIEPLSNAKATYYRFSINTLNDERVYGALGIPCGKGPFPVIAFFPGAGPGGGRPVDIGMTPRGAITLMMNVHKYPVSESPAEAKKQLDDYTARHNVSGYFAVGQTARETFHFYTVLAGFCRALDYVCAQEGWWDGQHLMISGSSQGGFLTLAMSSLYADKVTSAMAGVPYRCDFRRTHKMQDSAVLNTLAYYDPVNFARFIRCPMQLSVAFIDGSCPPATVFSAYNTLPMRDKSIMMQPRASHGTTPDRQAMERACILQGLMEDPLPHSAGREQ